MLWTAVFPPRGLGPRPGHGRAGAAPLGLRPLGAAGRPPGRQLCAVGSHGRLPHLAVALADRARARDGLELPGEPPGERGRRTLAGDIQPLVRAAGLRARELQARLDRTDRLHREAYPYRERLSRMEYFPGLKHSGRPYARDSEGSLWEWSHVTENFSTYVVVRRVDRSGLVSLYNRGHYVGRVHQGKDVYVMYDPQLNEWFFTDIEGRQLRRQPAEQLSRERVMKLEVTHRR